MPGPTAQQRSDPAAVRRMVDSIFEETSGDAKQSYCEFLAASIAYLSEHHADRWGVTLREYGVRLNAGMVESLVLRQGRRLRVLVERKSAPPRASFDGGRYRYAPGCETVALPLSDLPRSLANLTRSHHEALRIAADAMPPSRNIRGAHSPGVTKWLSRVLHHAVPNPVRPQRQLHIVQGGVLNGDKARLEDRRAPFWMVPKTATKGDELVIHIRGIGFFATARVTSHPRPRTDWKNRYRAEIDSVRLVRPPVSLAVLRRQFPDFGWAKYPRSITTPPVAVAERIRELISERRRGEIDLDEDLVESANMDELKMMALQVARVVVLAETITPPASAAAWLKLPVAAGVPDLVAAAVALRPDYVVADAAASMLLGDLLRECARGQNGALTALIARSSNDALYRLRVMSATYGSSSTPNDLLGSSLDVLVHAITLADGTLRVMEIAEPTLGSAGELRAETLLAWQSKGKGKGRFIATRTPSRLAGKLESGGVNISDTVLQR